MGFDTSNPPYCCHRMPHQFHIPNLFPLIELNRPFPFVQGCFRIFTIRPCTAHVQPPKCQTTVIMSSCVHIRNVLSFSLPQGGRNVRMFADEREGTEKGSRCSTRCLKMVSVLIIVRPSRHFYSPVTPAKAGVQSACGCVATHAGSARSAESLRPNEPRACPAAPLASSLDSCLRRNDGGNRPVFRLAPSSRHQGCRPVRGVLNPRLMGGNTLHTWELGALYGRLFYLSCAHVSSANGAKYCSLA
jgi:hypothetical protein